MKKKKSNIDAMEKKGSVRGQKRCKTPPSPKQGGKHLQGEGRNRIRSQTGRHEKKALVPRDEKKDKRV